MAINPTQAGIGARLRQDLAARTLDRFADPHCMPFDLNTDANVTIRDSLCAVVKSETLHAGVWLAATHPGNKH